MRICGILKIAAVLSADFILLYLGFGVIAAGVITGGIFLYGWVSEYIAVLQKKRIPWDQLSEEEHNKIIRVKESLAEKIRRVSNRNISDLKVQVVSSDRIGAYAYGRHHVAVTQPLIDSCDEETICAVLGHEIYHVFCLDPVFRKIIMANITAGISSLVLAGVYASLGVLVILTVVLCFLCVTTDFKLSWIFRAAGRLSSFVITMTRLLIRFIYQMVMGPAGYNCEFRADRYSCRLGYGARLADYLVQFEEGHEREERSLYGIMYAYHPSARLRLEKLFPPASDFL